MNRDENKESATTASSSPPPQFCRLSFKDNAVKRESQPLSTTREPTNNGGGQWRRSMPNFVAVASHIPRRRSPRFVSRISAILPLISAPLSPPLLPLPPSLRSIRFLRFSNFVWNVRPHPRWIPSTIDPSGFRICTGVHE